MRKEAKKVEILPPYLPPARKYWMYYRPNRRLLCPIPYAAYDCKKEIEELKRWCTIPH